MPDPALASLTLAGAIPPVRNTMAKRIHVPPREWGQMLGTDYWLVASGELSVAGAASDLLSDWGWITTSLVETAGSGGDFGSSADVGTPPHLLTNASSDLLQSPAVFGSYAHMRAVQDILGYFPTKLIAEFWAAMTVHSADEVRSGWGFIEDGGSAATEADQLAWISSDGSNFQIAGNAGTPINGAADDANFHRFKIILNKETGKVTWEIDGVSQTMASALSITADEFPVSFGMHALTTNRPALAQVHIWYE